MKRLNRFALIATIAGTLFGIPWAIWTYWKSQESSTPTIASGAVIRGNQNFVIQGNNNVLKVPSESSPQQNSLGPEALLDTLNTGISRSSLEAQFGTAMFDTLDSESGFRNMIFVFPRFFLQTVITPDGNVVFYSVTTRSAEFRPEIPMLGGKLLEARFASFENSEHYYSRP